MPSFTSCLSTAGHVLLSLGLARLVSPLLFALYNAMKALKQTLDFVYRGPGVAMDRLRLQYGSVCHIMIADRTTTVVSNGGFIKALFSSDILKADVQIVDLVSALSGVEIKRAALADILNHHIHPIAGRFLRKKEFLNEVSPALALSLSTFIKARASVSELHDLSQLVDTALISSISEVIFGPSFPTDIIADLQLLDKTFYPRLCRLPFAGSAFPSARSRLLERLSAYLTRVEGQKLDIWPGYSLVQDYLNVCQLVGISGKNRAALFLSLVWGFTAASTGVTSWMLVFLLNNPQALAKVREEVNSALEVYEGDILRLSGDPNAFDILSFPTIDSAIHETLRLTSVATPSRQAASDIHLSDGHSSVLIKSGDFVMANIRAHHFDPSVYPDPHAFIVDRFSIRNRRRDVPIAFGGGIHACKGRLFAIMHMKIFVVLLTSLAEIELDEKETSNIPKVNQWAVNILRLDQNVSIKLKSRLYIDLRVKHLSRKTRRGGRRVIVHRDCRTSRDDVDDISNNNSTHKGKHIPRSNGRFRLLGETKGVEGEEPVPPPGAPGCERVPPTDCGAAMLRAKDCIERMSPQGKTLQATPRIAVQALVFGAHNVNEMQQ
ncbi:cytochrome P450 [Coniophora puteana RWD-64-598 SS2]|uniref:Cytochrome P450 n=1 Tax=Coniophora puteana (strain RWD-64-598) TaxID=741705 RepID=A0A5M3MN09_CONPW|nr:cytochrome P450 [Coniophora puteana RWD-64-598 SS2]EIW79991.1 cytochrome P450 [Coniophora puteana RWD-64-598 SS2]